jgi:hypothetical protein
MDGWKGGDEGSRGRWRKRSGDEGSKERLRKGMEEDGAVIKEVKGD